MPEALTEAQAEMQPDAVAGLALLDACLARRSEAEIAAFWEAVRCCYGSAHDEDAPSDSE